MADTIGTLRPVAGPSGVYHIDSFWVWPSGDFTTQLQDNSDSTYAEQANSGGTANIVLTDLTLPAGAQVRSLTVRVRASDPNNTGGATFATALETDSAGRQYTGNLPTLDSTIRTYTVATITSLNGNPLTGTLVNALRFVVTAYDSTSPGTQHHRIYELYVDVAYNQAPTATVTGPTGTITTDSRPPITHTYSDPEGDTQERVRRKVFSAAQVGFGGFNPDTSTPMWDSGVILSAATSKRPAALPNGNNYRAYVKVADTGSGGRYGPWDYSLFNLAVPAPPSAPTLTATAQTTPGRVLLDLTDNNSSLDPALDYTAIIERSDDGGTTWVPVRVGIGGNGTPSYDPVPITSAGQHYNNLYDWAAPYGALLYRAHEEADDPATDGSLIGDDSSNASVTYQPDDTWLKDPVRPWLNIVVEIQLPFEYARRNATAVTDTLGSPLPTGRSDNPKGEAGKAVIDTIGQAEHDALDLLVGSGNVLLLQLPAGERQRYLLPVSDMSTIVMSLADSTSSFRQSTFDWVEVAAP